MSPGFDHPLSYPAAVSVGALAGCGALMPFADLDQRSALLVVVSTIAVATAYRLVVAFRKPDELRHGQVRRVRQQYRLTSRSWLEIRTGNQIRWLPVYFDTALVTMSGDIAIRPYPSGRAQQREPIGRLVDDPTRPDQDAPRRAARNARWHRRLLLDAQSSVVAPFAALLWLYVVGGGIAAFAGSTVVAALATLWLAAIRGSDPT